MFAFCNNLTTLDLSGFNLIHVPNNYCAQMFLPGGANLTEIKIPRRTGDLENEIDKWYCINSSVYGIPPTGKSFTLVD